MGPGTVVAISVDSLRVRGAIRVVHVAGQRGFEGSFDLLDLVPRLLICEVQKLRPDQEDFLFLAPPDPTQKVRGKLNQAPGLAELFVLLEKAEDVLVAGVERIGANNFVSHLFGRLRECAASDRLLVGGQIGLRDLLHLYSVWVRKFRKQPLAQDIVNFARVQIDRGD